MDYVVYSLTQSLMPMQSITHAHAINHSCPFSPGVMEGLELPFYGLTPDVLGSPSFPLLLCFPLKGCTGDVGWLSSRHKSNPSPLPLHDDNVHAVLVQRARIFSLEMVSGRNIRRIPHVITVVHLSNPPVLNSMINSC